VTKQPQFDFGGKAEVTLGNYDQRQAKATVTGPLSDTVAVRLSGSVNKRDGYATNVTTGNDVNNRDRWSIRGDLLWVPTDQTSGPHHRRLQQDHRSLLRGELDLQRPGHPVHRRAVAVWPGQAGRRSEQDLRPRRRLQHRSVQPPDGKGISGQIDHDLGFAKLTSITAYREQTSASYQDVDFTGADLANKDDGNTIKTFTQELRLASNGDGPFSWLVGGFYQDEKLDTGRTINYGGDIRAYARA
jgi:iron complex outermembrane receptor protein